MADTGTVTYTRSEAQGVKQIDFAWISDASGDAELAISEQIAGQLLRVVTKPVGAPTDDYDVTLLDHLFADMLNGKGANRDTANVETAIVEGAAGAPVLVSTTAPVFKVANAGNVKAGTVTVFWK